MAKIAKTVEKPVELSLEEKVGNAELAKFLTDHNAEECSLGPVGYLYRIECKKCSDPRCTRIVVKTDESHVDFKYLWYRSCEKKDSREFTNINHIAKYLEV